jgi:hypothetical protein
MSDKFYVRMTVSHSRVAQIGPIGLPIFETEIQEDILLDRCSSAGEALPSIACEVKNHFVASAGSNGLPSGIHRARSE